MPPKKEEYDAKENYGISKTCNILFTRQLQKEFAGTNRTAYSLHPGIIPSTELFKNSVVIRAMTRTLFRPLFKSIPQGAATTIYCAIHPEAKKHAGEYFSDCHVDECSNDAKNAENAENLWKISEDCVREALAK